MAIIIEKDATVYSLFISVNCSTCFEWYFHPSSGAHSTVRTVLWAPDDGWKYHSKHVEQLTDINKLFTVASFPIIIAIYYTMHGPLNQKFLNVT